MRWLSPRSSWDFPFPSSQILTPQNIKKPQGFCSELIKLQSISTYEAQYPTDRLSLGKAAVALLFIACGSIFKWQL
jgi:hypothetical protein